MNARERRGNCLRPCNQAMPPPDGWARRSVREIASRQDWLRNKPRLVHGCSWAVVVCGQVGRPQFSHGAPAAAKHSCAS